MKHPSAGADQDFADDLANLLVGISFYAQSLKRASKPADDAYETADAIERAARLGIGLVERRFGFGRSAETGNESVGVQGVREDATVTRDEAADKEGSRKRTGS